MIAQLARIGTAAALLALIGTSSVLAGGKCRKACCPQCETCCELKIEEGTEEKHCWKTEQKTVCIPKVTFSWQWPFQKKKSQQSCDANCDGGCGKPSCAPPKLSRTRKVCTLVKETIECPVCKYKWVPKEETPCTVCEETEITSLGHVVPQPMSPQQVVQDQVVAPIVTKQVAQRQASVPAPPVSRPVVLRLSN